MNRVFLIITSGSFSRSAVNYNAGAQTAVSNIVMSLAVLVTLLFLMPLFYYTPNVILAAIIVTAVIGLIDYEAAYKLWKVDKLDFLACLCSFFGVLFISVPLGLTVAVSKSNCFPTCSWFCLGFLTSIFSGGSFGFEDSVARNPTKHSWVRKHLRDSDIPESWKIYRSFKNPFFPNSCHRISYLFRQL